MKSVNAPLFDTFVFHQCYTCGVWSAVPAQKYEAARREGDRVGYGIYCPNGHATCFAEADKSYRLNVQREQVLIASAPDLLPTFTPRPPDPPAPPAKPRKRASRPRVPVKCPICQRDYKNRASLREHQRRAHPGEA